MAHRVAQPWLAHITHTTGTDVSYRCPSCGGRQHHGEICPLVKPIEDMSRDELMRELNKAHNDIKWLTHEVDVYKRAVNLLRAELGIR